MKFNIEVEMTPSEFKEITGLNKFDSMTDILESQKEIVKNQAPWLKFTQEMTDQMINLSKMNKTSK